MGLAHLWTLNGQIISMSPKIITSWPNIRKPTLRHDLIESSLKFVLTLHFLGIVTSIGCQHVTRYGGDLSLERYYNNFLTSLSLNTISKHLSTGITDLSVPQSWLVRRATMSISEIHDICKIQNLSRNASIFVQIDALLKHFVLRYRTVDTVAEAEVLLEFLALSARSPTDLTMKWLSSIKRKTARFKLPGWSTVDIRSLLLI